MKDFDRRWLQAAKLAQEDLAGLPLEAPFGFATRLASRWTAHPSPAAQAVFERLALRFLQGALAALALSVLIQALDSAAGRVPALNPPPVEESVPEANWLL